MQTLCDDPVSVVVAFTDDGKVRPWKIRWGNALYHVRRVNMVHGSREGRTRIFYFSCSNDTNAWKLRLDTETLEWRMVEHYAGA
ncbi:hypothetical protein EPO33_00615 [Patescibacteria group bacterium]|nr:MAG: hypothetical protein EPO33_00615 [Patescibacteria group bacterium]